MGFPCGSAGKESACSVGDLGLTPGLGRSLGEGNGYPCQYPGLANSVDCIVHGVAKSQTQLNELYCLSQPYMTTGKTIALTRWTVVGEVTSVLFNNVLSRLVAASSKEQAFLILICGFGAGLEVKDHATKPETPSSLPAPPQMPLPEIPQPWLVSARPTISFFRVHMYALIYSICFPFF